MAPKKQIKFIREFFQQRYRVVIFVVLLALFVPFGADAENNKLPEPMYSKGVEVTDPAAGMTFYGGFYSNEVIFNDDQNTMLGFNKTILAGTCGTMPNWSTRVLNCFELYPNSTSMKLMNSRVRVNDIYAHDMTALLYPDATVIGDVFSGSGDMRNFALYGRNLAKSAPGGTNAQNGTWDVKGYTLNPAAQSSYTADQKTYFDTHVNQLQGEAQTVSSSVSGGILWMQGNDLRAGGTDESAKYPDGKVWYAASGDFTLNGTITVKGKGTIIVENNLIIKPGTKITLDPSDPSASLGIIVKGNVNLDSNVSLNAAVFARGNIDFRLKNNIELIGSFVANSIARATGSGIRVYYDYKLDNQWPPGFRYFNMPTPHNVAP